MNISEDNVKIIFGLKMKQLRTERKLSLTELSKTSGLSVSYLNEIEKGKKYPKSGKILAIGNALGVSYDELVSLKLDNKLAPIGKLLRSRFFEEFPLEIFGIELSKLIEIVSKAPTKVSAFISTLTELSRNFSVSTEHFYRMALRAYQELHGNYFEELEKAAESFSSQFNLEERAGTLADKLEKIVTQEYGYIIDYEEIGRREKLQQFRFLVLDTNEKRLFVNPALDDSQRAFVLARQVGFNFLSLKEHALSSPWLKVESFDQVLSNFRASYFAGALIIKRGELLNDLNEFMKMPTWDGEKLVDLLNKYSSSPDTFMQRFTNILTQYFNIKNLFFLRIHQPQGKDYYKITKELHFGQVHAPHGNELEQHYCRRWMAIRVLDDIERKRKNGSDERQVAGIQRSRFYGSDAEYLVISLGRTMLSQKNTNYSVAIGFTLNKDLKKRIRFWQDPGIPSDEVNVTCERCPITNCKERVAEPVLLHQEENHLLVRKAIEELTERY